MSDKLHLHCKHEWKNNFDYDECKKCHCMRRMVRATYRYWSVDGQQFTCSEIEDPDGAIAFVEAELKK